MRIRSWAETSFRFCCGVLLLVSGSTLHAAAGIKIEEFGYIKNDLANPTLNTRFIDQFDGDGPLANPAGGFGWQARVGTVLAGDESGGDLNLKPELQGAPFNIGPYAVTGQVMELQTPPTGSAAINNQLNTSFVVFAMYELGYTMRDDLVAGVGLTDVFRGGTRGVAATVGREGGQYYGKFSDAVTGDILDKRFLTIPATARYLELFIGREHQNSDSVISGYNFLDERLFTIQPPTFFSGVQLALSDAALRPVLFAAVIPEPQTWALMIMGLALVGYRASQRRITAA